MEYKWIGAGFVIAACGGLGMAVAGEQRQDERLLGQLLRAVQSMRAQLSYQLTPLPELCRKIPGRGTVVGLLARLGAELEAGTAASAQDGMKRVLAQEPRLPPMTRGALEELGASLGRFDLDGQLRGLESVRSGCEASMERLSRDRESRLRGIRTLGFCGGTALAILLL